MGLLLLLVLYGTTAAACSLLVRPAGRRTGAGAVVVLSVLPLAFTWGGFLPRRTLAPTNLVLGVAPWGDRELVKEVEAVASPPNPLLLDPVTQTIPWRQAGRRHLLFNPAQGSGAALLANAQSALLYPTELLARGLAPFRAVTYSQAARLLIGVWGAFLLLRLCGLAEASALGGATVFAGAGFLQLWRLHPHSLVAATAPWIVAAGLVLLRRPGPGAAVALAVGGTVGFYGGHPETLLHVLLFAVPAVLLLHATFRSSEAAGPCSGRSSDDRHLAPVANTRLAPGWAVTLWGGAAALLAVLFAAPLLLPFVENLLVSDEWQIHRHQRRQEITAPLSDVFERLRPAGALYALGDPLEENWTGPENLVELGGGAMGAAALFLFLLGLLGAPAAHRSAEPLTGSTGSMATEAERQRGMGKANRWSLSGLAGLGLLGLLVSAHMPVVSTPFGWIPLLRDSLLKRLSLWWVLAVAVVAAVGIEALLRRRPTGRMSFVGPLFSAVAVGGVVLLASSEAPASERTGIWTWELGALVVALIGAILLHRFARTATHPPSEVSGRNRDGPVPSEAGRNGRGGTGARRMSRSSRGRTLLANVGGVLVFAALLLPRAVLFHLWVPSVPPEGFYAPTPALHVVEARLDELGPVGFRIAGVEGALAPHTAALFALEEARAYDPLTFAPYARFLESLGELPRPGWVRLLHPSRPELAFLGVRFVFDQPRTRRRHRRVQVAYRGPDAVVWERSDALPRAFFPKRFQVQTDPDRAFVQVRDIQDFATLAVVDRGSRPEAEEPSVRTNPAATVESLEVGAGSIRAAVAARGPAILATSQPAIPGWRLRLDGARAPERLRRINGAFLGVAVPAGEHAVDLLYAPMTWRVGCMLAAVGGIAAAALLLLRRPPGEPRLEAGSLRRPGRR